MTAEFRRPSKEERTAINRTLDMWRVFDALKDSTFLVMQEGRSKRICIVSPELEARVLHLAPHFAGLVIGEMAKHFLPTIAGADLFVRNGGSGRFYVTVNENAEKLVLYGRDVMGDSILVAWPDLSENELVIITNSRGEAIGVGRTRFAGRLIMQKSRITITTIADAGRYLREEGESRAKMLRSPARG